jgi:AcrR family transcriptional regulator
VPGTPIRHNPAPVATEPRSPRRRLSAAERRAEILEAALGVFSSRGYHASSIDEIAQVAGISKALIYEHFDSKASLHLSLLEMYTAELAQRVAEAAAPGPSAARRLEGGLDAFFAFVEERRGAWQMIFREVADSEAAAALDRMTAQVTALVATLIAEDPLAREPAENEPGARPAIEAFAQMIVGSAQGLANWWSVHPEVPRALLVELSMDFAWLGLGRLSAGERWSQVRSDESG